MAQGSTRFEHLEKSIDDYIIEQQNKNTRVKTTRDVKLLIEFLREKHDQRNPEDIEAAELNEYADSSRAIQGCSVLRRKFHYQYQLVLVFNGRT